MLGMIAGWISAFQNPEFVMPHYILASLALVSVMVGCIFIAMTACAYFKFVKNRGIRGKLEKETTIISHKGMWMMAGVILMFAFCPGKRGVFGIPLDWDVALSVFLCWAIIYYVYNLYTFSKFIEQVEEAVGYEE